VVRYSARINGIDALALTKLDVLDGLPDVQICVGYRTTNGMLDEFPADLARACQRGALLRNPPRVVAPHQRSHTCGPVPLEAHAIFRRSRR